MILSASTFCGQPKIHVGSSHIVAHLYIIPLNK